MVCLFWAAVQLAEWIEMRAKAKIKLCIFMLVTALLYLGHGAFFSKVYDILPLSDTIYCMANLAVFPLYNFYIKEVTGTEKENVVTCYALWLAPSLLIGIGVGTAYAIMMKEGTAMLFFETYLYKNSCDGLHGWALAQCYLHIAARIIFAFIVPTVFALGYKEIKAYNTDIEAFYADTNDKKFSYSREILVLFITTCIISFVANIIGRERFGSSVWLIMIPSHTFSSLLFMLGYAGHKISFQPQEQPPSLSAFSGEQASEESDQIEQLRYRIESLMEKERLYLQPELKVSDVAKYMSTNRDYIYQAINVKMGVSFSKYVNKKRVEHAKKLLQDTPSISMRDLSISSGFNSQASFYRNFKLHTGISPQKYLNSMEP